MRKHCKTTSKTARLLLVPAALLFLGQSVLAQPEGAGDGVAPSSDAPQPQAAGGDAVLTEDAALADDVVGLTEADYEGLAELDEADIPEGLRPLASTIVADEITVRGTRPGDIRKRLWDIDIEIERSTLAFFKLLNEIIVDEQFHVECVRPQRQRNAQGQLSSAIIIERRCYAGYQADAMRFGENPTWLMEKEREYTEIVMTAIEEIPSLAVAAENLSNMHEERRTLTGGDPALTAEQYRRDLARRDFEAPFVALERRRQRRAEREAERAAERAVERAAQAQSERN